MLSKEKLAVGTVIVIVSLISVNQTVNAKNIITDRNYGLTYSWKHMNKHK